MNAKKFITVLISMLSTVLSSCAHHHDQPQQDQLVRTQKSKSDRLEQSMAPIFRLSETQNNYNKIGQVIAIGTKNHNSITINPDNPVVYVDTSQFFTEKSRYTNLIYRVHFLKQPFSLIPFNYGAGQHVGLLVILTLNNNHQVILVTTAQTCGCYAISIPTATLDSKAYPRDWPDKEQLVAGEILPARLPAIGQEDVLQVALRPEVHRVMDLRVVANSSIKDKSTEATISNLATLKQLPLEDGSYTSFYHQHWPLAGHVKGAIKPWETLFLGLASLDFFVGMDKEYGDTRESGNPFYTSLKPWNRRNSDMNNFAIYLKFNGWDL